MKVAIIYYSTWGHLAGFSEQIKKGVEEAGGKADIFQIEETLPSEVLEKMYAAPKPEYPIATVDTLKEYDAFLFGISTRYGNFSAQWKSYWDQTGGLWAGGDLVGKPFGLFISTGTPGGGQESTARTALSSFIHHGMIYIPLGYGEAFPYLSNVDEVHGGSAWGAGMFAGADGSRQATELENKVATIQGKSFYTSAVKFAKTETKSEKAAEKVETKAETKAAATSEKPARETQSKPAVKENESTCSKCIVM